MVLVLSGCATTGAATEDQKRRAILDMKQEVLADLYRVGYGAKAKIANAPGYAVLSNANMKAGDKGDAVGGEILLDGVTIYQSTENGLALQATLTGTKYWRDSELN